MLFSPMLDLEIIHSDHYFCHTFNILIFTIFCIGKKEDNI